VVRGLEVLFSGLTANHESHESHEDPKPLWHPLLTFRLRRTPCRSFAL